MATTLSSNNSFSAAAAAISPTKSTSSGFAIAPVFAGVMALQTRLVVKCEARNKKVREDVARGITMFVIVLLFFFPVVNLLLLFLYRPSLTSVSVAWHLKDLQGSI